jgi:undecaprenyl diphosphate synthase
MLESIIHKTHREQILDLTDHGLRHLAIIPDGNRRWAREHGLLYHEGHRIAFLKVTPNLLEHAWKCGIHTLTVWLFSCDNWKRSDEEVNRLMSLYEVFLNKIELIASELQVSMLHIGRKDRIPETLLEVINKVENSTSHHTRFQFLFALDYNGTDEVNRAANRFASENKQLPFALGTLDKFLDTANARYPNPDVIIRTSGEIRTSGFMPLQSQYSEYFFLQKYYPDINIEDLEQVISEYQKRNKRNGS